MVARWAHNPEVVGSNPTAALIFFVEPVTHGRREVTKRMRDRMKPREVEGPIGRQTAGKGICGAERTWQRCERRYADNADRSAREAERSARGDGEDLDGDPLHLRERGSRSSDRDSREERGKQSKSVGKESADDAITRAHLGVSNSFSLRWPGWRLPAFVFSGYPSTKLVLDHRTTTMYIREHEER